MMPKVKAEHIELESVAHRFIKQYVIEVLNEPFEPVCTVMSFLFYHIFTVLPSCIMYIKRTVHFNSSLMQDRK